MSLYNMVMGTNPCAGLILTMLGYTKESGVPRLRDAYVDSDNYLVVFTRTGGANRQDYQEQNKVLTAHPWYRDDQDWELDPTFAKWRFKVPAEHEHMVALLVDNGAYMDPTVEFNRVMQEMQNPNSATSQKALEQMEPVINQIRQAVASGQPAIVVADGDGPLASPQTEH